jgi:UDP-glucose 4-epimerase
MDRIFQHKKILVTGGTGSLGGTIVMMLLSGRYGLPKQVRILSRDESKQYDLENLIDMKYERRISRIMTYSLGDIRNYQTVLNAVHKMDIVIHAAALKHVPACEENVEEAVMTNILGSVNIVKAVRHCGEEVSHVIAVSTDKACLPMSSMGMTKALMERVFKEASRKYMSPKFLCVRMGNMLMSRGSVVPLFKRQIAAGGPITITHPHMTRFFILLGTVTDHICYALEHGSTGTIYVPRMKSVNIEKLACVMMGLKKIPIKYTGIRMGEKLHDILINEHESRYAHEHGNGWFINLGLPVSDDPDFREWSYHSGQSENYMPLLKVEEMLRYLGE